MALKINDNGIDRDMTSDEEAAHLTWAETAQAEAQARAETLEAKQVARQAVLDKLGLTADEAAALLG
jgi:ParB-like chromosome segregation protein Spo0J